MADRTVEGRVIFAGTSNGIAGLNIVAVDFDPFFLEDRLGSASTDANGNFKITYAQSRYSEWLPERKPDIAVRVHTAGGRLLHPTTEQKHVSVPNLTIATIEIHRANVEGWLVTNATLNPTNPKLTSAGVPITWTTGNSLEVLKDGESLFPRVTDAVSQANQTVHCMNMNFWLGPGLITKYPALFDPQKPPLGAPVA